MADWQVVLALTLAALVCLSPGFFLLYDLHKESRGYEEFAKKMREIRDWERKTGTPPGQSALRPFKDTFRDH